MCPWHWKLVPSELQVAVYATYRPGQERDKRPSTAYLIATTKARIAVCEAERLPVPSYLPLVLLSWEEHEAQRQRLQDEIAQAEATEWGPIN